MLASSAREFLERECPMSLVRDAMDDPSVAIDALWKPMAELGWTGLAVPEEHGGSGLGWTELAILAEEMGRVLLPAPYVSSAVVATALLRELASAEQSARWLPALAEGHARGTLTLIEPSASSKLDDLAIEAAPSDGGVVLKGVKCFVEDAGTADWLLVPARSSEGIEMCRVETTAAGLVRRRVDYSDRTRPVYEVTFDRVQVDGDSRLPRSADLAGSLESVLDGARAVLAAEMVGASERVLEMSVAFAKDREQFGRPIGSFQAIQHKCANMLVRLESARSAARYAAWAVSAGEPTAHTAALLAKAHCSEVFTEVAGEGIQIHGGLGFTWEQDLHLYFKRAMADQVALGDPGWCREQVARLVIDEGAPAP